MFRNRRLHASYRLHLATRAPRGPDKSTTNPVVLWAFRAPLLCGDGASMEASWTEPFFLTSSLELVGLSFPLGFFENELVACWIAESSLDCWDFAYIDSFRAVF